MTEWAPGDDEITVEFDNSSGRYTTLSTGGFIQFGDGEPTPVTNISWTLNRDPEPDLLPLPRLSDFEVTIPIPPQAVSTALRLVGEEGLADGIDVAYHPDLAELNVQMDGYYDAP